jgi:hypothetical protein
VSLIALTLIAAAAVDEVAIPPEPSGSRSPTLEVSGMAGPSLVTGEPATPDATDSFRRVGIYGELAVAYRSRYFLDPFVSVGYGTLASADTELQDGAWGEGGTLSQRLDTWLVSPGVTADFFRFRLRLGLGLAIVVQRYDFRGDESATTQLPIAGQVGLGFNLLESPALRLDVESKFVRAAGADVTFAVLGVTARGDLFDFH